MLLRLRSTCSYQRMACSTGDLCRSKLSTSCVSGDSRSGLIPHNPLELIQLAELEGGVASADRVAVGRCLAQNRSSFSRRSSTDLYDGK